MKKEEERRRAERRAKLTGREREGWQKSDHAAAWEVRSFFREGASAPLEPGHKFDITLHERPERVGDEVEGQL